MFDFGWPELLLIAAIAALVIGPDEIPVIMQGLGRMVRRLQYMRFALSQQFDDFMNEAEISRLREDAANRQDGDADTESAADEIHALPPAEDNRKDGKPEDGSS